MLFIKKKAKEAEMEKMKAVEAEQPKPETVKCPKCGAELDKQRVVKAKYICYECGSYFRVKTKNRIKMVTDPKSFEPWFEDMPMSNPLNTAGYEDKVKAAQEKTGLQMAYLVDGDGKGDFWMYDSSDSSFSPAEQVVISDTYSIVIFDAGSKVSMPSKYAKGNLEINGKTFEIWDEPDRDGFYVLYAVNNDGEESLYLYDSVEHTYQRMETPKSATTPDKKSASKFDAILEKISDHLIWFVAAAAVIVILLVIFLLVSVVKLHNRNRELDDLYDEYELDDEPQRNPVKPIQPVKAEKKSQFKKRQDDDFEDDYDDFDDDFDDDDYYDDDFDDDYDDEGISDDTRSVDEFDDYFDDDDFDSFDDYNIKKEKRKKGDTFEMDFIDLD